MKITSVQVVPFRVRRTDFGNAEVYPEHEVIQTLTKIVTDEGAEGYYLGGHGHGDRDGLPPHERAYVEGIGQSMLVGQDPYDREKFWQWLSISKTPENIMGVIDMALWDLAGRAAGQPVYRLMGGYRDRVLAYASTYPNMGTPEDYAQHALDCQRQGYKAYKIHPYYFWNPNTRQSVPGRPSFVREDIEVCRAVTEAVGDEMLLMFDPWGTYNTYEDALLVGRELERLGFYWYEHPLNEYRVEMYVRLCKDLEIEVVSPELHEGNLYTRADWIVRGASDISRIDVLRGGLTACKKTVGVCEAFGVKCEIHMSGFANLQLLAATSDDTCEFYERGLEAPGMDYDAIPPYLEENCDPLDPDGLVRVPQAPGLGYKIVWDYIRENQIKES